MRRGVQRTGHLQIITLVLNCLERVYLANVSGTFGATMLSHAHVLQPSMAIEAKKISRRRPKTSSRTSHVPFEASEKAGTPPGAGRGHDIDPRYIHVLPLPLFMIRGVPQA